LFILQLHAYIATYKFLLRKDNKIGILCINVTLKRVPVTIFIVKSSKYCTCRMCCLQP